MSLLKLVNEALEGRYFKVDLHSLPPDELTDIIDVKEAIENEIWLIMHNSKKAPAYYQIVDVSIGPYEYWGSKEIDRDRFSEEIVDAIPVKVTLPVTLSKALIPKDIEFNAPHVDDPDKTIKTTYTFVRSETLHTGLFVLIYQ